MKDKNQRFFVDHWSVNFNKSTETLLSILIDKAPRKNRKQVIINFPNLSKTSDTKVISKNCCRFSFTRTCYVEERIHLLYEE